MKAYAKELGGSIVAWHDDQDYGDTALARWMTELAPRKCSGAEPGGTTSPR